MIPGLDFVAVDVETANRKRGSVCSIGLARVRDGVIIKTRSWLVKPPVAESAGGGVFEMRCVQVHGITPKAIENAPRFADRYEALIRGLADDLLVAHNATFDRTALTAACAAEDLPGPGNRWLCTVVESRRVLAQVLLPDHRLPTVAAALGITQIRHHEAGDDAKVAALVRIELAAIAAGLRTLPQYELVEPA